MPALSRICPPTTALCSQGVPVILPAWVPLSVPLAGELASVTLTLAHALVCPTSQAGHVTIVLMDAGMSSPAEDVSHVIVTPGPHSVDTVTRQETFNFLWYQSEMWWGDMLSKYVKNVFFTYCCSSMFLDRIGLIWGRSLHLSRNETQTTFSFTVSYV